MEVAAGQTAGGASGSLQGVQRWVLYYGFGALDLLADYELAALAPGGHSRSELRWLRDRGVRLLAYVSALEVPRQAGVRPPATALWSGAAPFANEVFNNWVLDPRHTATARRLVNLATAAREQGFDGLFLDTLGMVEDRRLAPALIGELVPAAAWLVAELARQFPDAPIVQNWGFEHLLPLTAPSLAGVCWEDFPWQDIGPLPSLHSGIRTMARLQEQFGLRVLALNQGLATAADRHAAREAAERCGFAWYGAPSYLEPVAFEEDA